MLTGRSISRKYFHFNGGVLLQGLCRFNFKGDIGNYLSQINNFTYSLKLFSPFSHLANQNFFAQISRQAVWKEVISSVFFKNTSLLIFHFSCSFLNYFTITALGLSISLGVRYWNRQTPFNKILATNSYNLYLSHYNCFGYSVVYFYGFTHSSLRYRFFNILNQGVAH